MNPLLRVTELACPHLRKFSRYENPCCPDWNQNRSNGHRETRSGDIVRIGRGAEFLGYALRKLDDVDVRVLFRSKVKRQRATVRRPPRTPGVAFQMGQLSRIRT